MKLRELLSEMRRGDDHRGLRQELAHETNNIAIAINGKTWKVVPGRGTADSEEEWSYLNNMKNWAEKKSASSGKQWTVSLTGANVTEQGMAEADELRARGGIEAVNKKPRSGQTDFRDIPSGNYPGSKRKFSDKDREEQPGRLKAAIKSTLGKHTTPNLPEQNIAEGSAHGYNVVRFYRKFKNPSKITTWLKQEAGLPKETKLYFDDADLVLGSDTIVPYALVDDTLKFNDLLTALVKVTGGTSKEKVDGVYRDQGVVESATAGATSAANIGTVVNPHHSPGKARGKTSYTGSPGKSGTKTPPQPKVVQPKGPGGVAKNGLDIKGASLFGGPTTIKRR